MAGVKATNPGVKVLTNFSGNQDDNALSKRIALAQMAAGADVVFTMLNAGRTGVTEACREKGTRQIGNVIDWVQRDPTVFVRSAMADVSMTMFQAVSDACNGKFPAGTVQKIGISNPLAVSLNMASDLPANVRQHVEAVAHSLAQGETTVTDVCAGPEFPNPT